MDKLDLKQALAKGGRHLGDLVWWSLAEARVQRTALEALWAGAGLDAGLLPEVPDTEKALRQACKEAGVGLKKDHHEIRCSFEDSSKLLFEVMEFRWDDLSNETVFKQESTIQLDLQNPASTPSVGGADTTVTQSVQAKFTELLTTHTTGDVGKMLVRTLQSMQAFGLRSSGGVYFVPEGQAVTVRNLRDVVGQLGGSAMEIVPVHEDSTGQAQRSLGAAAQRSLEKDLADLVGELQRFVATPPRADTLDRRLEAFKDLRSRAEFYKTLLGSQVDGLEQGLEQMEGIVQSMLSKIEE